MSLLGKSVSITESLRTVQPLLDKKTGEQVVIDGEPQEELVVKSVSRVGFVIAESEDHDDVTLFVMRAEGGTEIKTVHASDITAL